MKLPFLLGSVMLFACAWTATRMYVSAHRELAGESSEQGSQAVAVDRDPALDALTEQALLSVHDAFAGLASDAPIPKNTPSGPLERDDEWERFPRRSSIMGFLMRCPPEVPPSALFRNKELNPRDKYLPRNQRQQLVICLQGIQPQLEQLYAARVRAYGDALAMADEQGLLRETSIEPTLRSERLPTGEIHAVESVSIAALAAEGVDMGTTRGGRIYGASRADFPLSRTALELERFVGTELACAVIQWFELAGTLEPPEAELLRAQAFR